MKRITLSSPTKLYPRIAALVFLSLHSIDAADYHFTPDGAGEKDGQAWESALSAKDIQDYLSEKVTPGDRVLLGSGTYSSLPHSNNTLLVLSRSGEEGKPISFEGVDTGGGIPLIQGKWKETNVRYHAHSSTAISLRGVAHVSISKLRICNCMHGIRAGGSNSNVTFEDISITRCREGFTLSGISDSKIKRCSIDRYTKRGFRFDAECQRLSILGTHADASSGDPDWPLEGFPFGFSIEDDAGNHHIHFERCTARNNIHKGGAKDYWNGDGFVAETAASNISYTGCSAFDNTDGGWDDKSLAPVFENCIAARNKRGFRIWNLDGDKSQPARLTNCLGVFNVSRGGIGSSAGLWTRGRVVVERSTFHNNGTAAIALENNAPGGDVTAVACIFSADAETGGGSLVIKEGGTTFEEKGSVHWEGIAAGESPDFVAPSTKWSGTPPDAFDSRRFGAEAGYRSRPE